MSICESAIHERMMRSGVEARALKLQSFDEIYALVVSSLRRLNRDKVKVVVDSPLAEPIKNQIEAGGQLFYYMTYVDEVGHDSKTGRLQVRKTSSIKDLEGKYKFFSLDEGMYIPKLFN